MARQLQTQHVSPQSVIASDGVAESAAPAGGGFAAGAGFAGGFGGGQGPTAGPVSSGGETVVRDGRKVGRNEPCPCGSGKKFKHCHGQI
jgi:preprotein translocase subunit SecA